MEGKVVPTGVKVVSVLYYIGSAFMLLMAILLFVGAGFMGNLLSTVPLIGSFGSGFFIVIGVILLAFGALGILIGWGLWKGMPAARIGAIIIAALGIISGILSIIGGDYSSVIGLAINGAVGGYLLFSSEVKSAFSASA
ncbi:MAG: hypothetical protein AABX33_01875 [Nanoarchaeota archaeon]